MAARIAVVDQCVQIHVCDGINAAAASTVAAIGPAKGNEFFTSETRAARTAVAGGDVNRGFINEFHGWILEAKKPRHAGASLAGARLVRLD